MIYRIPAGDDPLTQGDILDNCPILEWAATPGPEFQRSGIILRIRAVVLTQACDLAESKATSVVVAVVHEAETLVQRSILKAALIRDQVRRHRVYGWYFLPAGETLRESIVDLRHLHTVPRHVLEGLIEDGKRICRLATPYREHLAQHFATTYSRIGLPEPYETRAD
jgi:hypothetical protein